MENMTILGVYRETFGFCPTVARFLPGQTLDEMRRKMASLPRDFTERGVICVNGQPAPRALWDAIRPKPGAVTEVTFHYAPAGSGDDGKSILAIIASIAITIAGGWIVSGGLAGLWGTSLFAANSVSALALAGVISLAGSLLISSLAPPPVSNLDDRGGQRSASAAAAEGNVLAPNGAIPRVVGERKVYPPLGIEPFVYFDGPDEIVDAAYILSGPHRIRDVSVGATRIGDIPEIQTEIREGWPGSPLIEMLDRQTRTEMIQSEIRGFVLSDTDARTMDSLSGDLLFSLPQPQTVATRTSPDEHQLQLVFAQGLSKMDEEDVILRVPVRIRIRPLGGEWVNLPEIHYQGSRPSAVLRTTVRLVWGAADSIAADAAVEGWVEARYSSPGQTELPASDDWVADSTFYSGSGPVYLQRNNVSSSGVRNVHLSRYTASLYLDESVFPRGRYDIEITRGAVFSEEEYNPEDYTYEGSVWNLFGYRGPTGIIVMEKKNIADTLHLLRSVSVWNEHPLPSRDLAVVAVRARNRQLDSVSFIAGGWVKDWSGTAWDNWTVTSNPAPHLRDVYTGPENNRPVPESIIDNDELLAWRQHCIDMDYTCDAIIADQSVEDAARIITACGYARPRMSDMYGVVYDRDRSSEDPVQTFTSRNIRDFKWSKTFTDLPEGLRVNYRDETRDFEMHQISVYRPGVSDDSGLIEQVTYEGIITNDDAVRRALFDLRQSLARDTTYSFECGVENILCRRGNLVAVQHSSLSAWSGSARVLEIVYGPGDTITEIVLDSEISYASGYFLDESPDLSLEMELDSLGRQTGVALSGASGVSVYRPSGSDGRSLFFDPPIAASAASVGSLVAVGPLGMEFMRLIVFSVTPKPDLTATVTLVDEAPQLWN